MVPRSWGWLHRSNKSFKDLLITDLNPNLLPLKFMPGIMPVVMNELKKKKKKAAISVFAL